MIVASEFQPAAWLPGPHAQTLWPRIQRRQLPEYVSRERLFLPDGDFIDLDWGPPSPANPLVLVLHGLEGSSNSHYVRGLMGQLGRRGVDTVAMNLRGCSGEPNRLSRSYHSGDSDDVRNVIRYLRRRHPGRPLGVVGYSLGGNIVLKWLGERGDAADVEAAAAVSVPFSLAHAADRLQRGFSRVYQAALLSDLRHSLERKMGQVTLPVELELRRIRDFRAFDNAVTAPLNGFIDAEDYYQRCSCRPYLGEVTVPTLILHSRDDPFIDPAGLPEEEELSPSVTLALSEAGGHVGFISGPPWAPHYWLESRLGDYFAEMLGAQVPQVEVGLAGTSI